MATVIGASPIENWVSVCGTLSSRILKLFRGISGMGLPLLSSTCTSMLTTFVSAWNVASVPVSLPFVAFGLSFDGIGGRSLPESAVLAAGVDASGAGVDDGVFRGLATVWLPCELGPSCAHTPTMRLNAAIPPTIQIFMCVLPL